MFETAAIEITPPRPRSALVGDLTLGWLLAGLAVASACSARGPGPNGASLCEPSCPTACGQDSDCDVSGGELCCNYGSSFGKACQQASSCPAFCTSDSQCDTSAGEACCLTILGTTQTVCSPTCLVPCTQQAECEGLDGGADCMTSLEEPACVHAADFRSSCNSTSDCAAGAGLVCCTTLSLALPGLIGDGVGICVGSPDPIWGACPVACNGDSECAGQGAGGICCNGMCAGACASTCKNDQSCLASGNGSVCCGVGAIASPFWPLSQ